MACGRLLAKFAHLVGKVASGFSMTSSIARVSDFYMTPAIARVSDFGMTSSIAAVSGLAGAGKGSS